MGSQAELPPEIVRFILNQLVGDQETLSQCSLVSTSWRQPSQEVLFSSMNLRLRTDNLSKIDLLMEESPHLQSMIQILSVTLDPSLARITHQLDGPLGTFTRFSHVHTLHLFDTTHSSQSIFSVWVQKHLGHLFEFPYLKTVSIVGLRLQVDSTGMGFLKFLQDSPSLVSLEFIDIMFKASQEGQDGDEEPSNRSAIDDVASGIKESNLRNLTILPSAGVKDQACLRWLLSPFNLASLTGLSIRHGQPYLHQIIGSAQVLVKLVVTSDGSDYSEGIVDLSRAPKTLLSIVFKFFPYLIPRMPHLPRWLSQTIATIPSSNTISRMQFTTFFEYNHLPQLSFPLSSWIEEWSNLGSLLAPNNFPLLKRVKLSTFSDPLEFKDTNWYPEHINTTMKEGVESFFERDTPPFVIETHYGSLPTSMTGV